MENDLTFDNIKTPKVTIDPWLNQYKDVVLCPEKVEKAKKAIEKFGIPDLKKMK